MNFKTFVRLSAKHMVSEFPTAWVSYLDKRTMRATVDAEENWDPRYNPHVLRFLKEQGLRDLGPTKHGWSFRVLDRVFNFAVHVTAKAPVPQKVEPKRVKAIRSLSDVSGNVYRELFRECLADCILDKLVAHLSDVNAEELYNFAHYRTHEIRQNLDDIEHWTSLMHTAALSDTLEAKVSMVDGVPVLSLQGEGEEPLYIRMQVRQAQQGTGQYDAPASPGPQGPQGPPSAQGSQGYSEQHGTLGRG